ncbi:McbB family protein [Pseudomonas silvicola]|nr:McbB family protein [Pseudomonas silvicola]
MTTIKIHNYELLNFEDYSLLSSKKGITRIKSKKMIKALHELKDYCDTPTTTAHIDNILKRHQLTHIDLPDLDTLLKIDIDIPSPYFKRIVILHTQGEHWAAARNILEQEIKLPLTWLPLEMDSIKNIDGGPSLVILLPNSQNINSIKTMYFALARGHRENFTTVGYFTPDSFTMTQPYSISLANPCLFCSVDRVVHFETQLPSRSAWNATMKFCSTNNVDLPNPKLSALQHSLVIGLIGRKISAMTAQRAPSFYQDNVLSNTTINLHSSVICEERPPHWHLCDCLGGTHA